MHQINDTEFKKKKEKKEPNPLPFSSQEVSRGQDMKPRLFRDSEIRDEKNSKERTFEIAIIHRDGSNRGKESGERNVFRNARALSSSPPPNVYLDPCNPAVISMAAILTGPAKEVRDRRNTF